MEGLVPLVMAEQMMERNDPWHRPLRRTAFLCGFDGELFFHNDRKLEVLGTYRDVTSPEELALAILSDAAVWNEESQFPPNLFDALHRSQKDRILPTDEEGAVLEQFLRRLKTFYLRQPLQLLADIDATAAEINAYSLFYEDTREWKNILSHLQQTGW